VKSIRTRFLLGGVFVQAVTEAGASVMRDNCDHELKGPECGIVMSGETPEVLISLTRWVRLRCGRGRWVTAAPMPIKPPNRIGRAQRPRFRE
jgi:hypothetical protein